MKLSRHIVKKLIREEMIKLSLSEDEPKKKHKSGDVWKSDQTGHWQAIGPSGDQESFGDDKEAA